MKVKTQNNLGVNETLENSLLRLANSNSYLLNYLKGWEESLINFNDLFKDEFKKQTSSQNLIWFNGK